LAEAGFSFIPEATVEELKLAEMIVFRGVYNQQII
jgi:hypothetical protein